MNVNTLYYPNENGITEIDATTDFNKAKAPEPVRKFTREEIVERNQRNSAIMVFSDDPFRDW